MDQFPYLVQSQPPSKLLFLGGQRNHQEKLTMRRICALVFFVLFFLTVVHCAENATRTDTGKARRDHGNETHGDNQDTAKNRRREKEEAERVKLQQEARRKRAHSEKQKFGKSSAKSLMKESESEECDWTKNPIPFLKGELCGAHYKVLGLDRKGKLPEKAEIKKAYRQRSLEVHLSYASVIDSSSLHLIHKYTRTHTIINRMVAHTTF